MNAPIRRRTNLTMDAKLVDMAKELDVNLSRAAEDGVRRAVREKWKADNRAAMESQNAWLEKNGLPLAKWQVLKV